MKVILEFEKQEMELLALYLVNSLPENPDKILSNFIGNIVQEIHKQIKELENESNR